MQLQVNIMSLMEISKDFIPTGSNLVILSLFFIFPGILT